MSLWEDGWRWFVPKPSFTEEVPDPGTDPGAGPFICVQFNQDWLPYILGSLLQLTQPSSWNVTDPALLDDLLGRATKLMNLFAESGTCPVQEDGILTLTILDGQAAVSGNIVFTLAYPGVPLVDCSCDNPDLIASWSAVTPLGCTLTITAATPVIADLTAHITWSTNG